MLAVTDTLSASVSKVVATGRCSEQEGFNRPHVDWGWAIVAVNCEASVDAVVEAIGSVIGRTITKALVDSGCWFVGTIVTKG